MADSSLVDAFTVETCERLAALPDRWRPSQRRTYGLIDPQSSEEIVRRNRRWKTCSNCGKAIYYEPHDAVFVHENGGYFCDVTWPDIPDDPKRFADPVRDDG